MIEIYVGNLPYTTKAPELHQMFLGFELFSARVLKDPRTNRPRGFALITVEDHLAKFLVEAFNGANYKGRLLIVDYASEDEEIIYPTPEFFSS